MLFDVVMELGLEEITNELIFHNGKGGKAYTKVIGVLILIYKLSFLFRTHVGSIMSSDCGKRTWAVHENDNLMR